MFQPFKLYATATSGYLALQSSILVLAPRLIVTLIASEPRRITDLETYLCRSLGFALLTLAGVILPLTGTVPLATPGAELDAEGNPKADPYGYPTLITTTIYHLFSAFYLYTQLTYSWTLAFTLGITASGILFFFGVWVALFGGEKSRTSKKTGADKRTSNFPFDNKESARSIKKEEKKESKRRSVARTKSTS